MQRGLVGSEMCIRDRYQRRVHGNPQSTQNSIKTFKESIIRLENPFFVRCFRKLSILIFLIIFGTTIFEYIFTVSTLQFVKISFDNANLIHYRLSNFIEIPQIFRIIQNMYQNIETQTSEVYTNRLSTYKKMAAIKLEKFRGNSLKIKLMDHVYSEQHKEITEKAFILMGGETTYINMDSAITKYVSRGTELESYTEAQLSSYTSEDIDFKLIRLFKYMIESPKGTLTQAIGQSRIFFYEEVFNEIDRLKKKQARQLFILFQPAHQQYYCFSYLLFYLFNLKSIKYMYTLENQKMQILNIGLKFVISLPVK
eukprot:TRINITY_DN9111_c0_g1_i1.p1 TRINITY_DN9111_c0_g1~~TRINITY_DN9111_c0_g1_i1.p1  ORF type:complete len:311 (+),score=35.56 TRINITY_DN9111_c0_g1_i1:68-1000(+)